MMKTGAIAIHAAIIEDTHFGSITIDGKTYKHDVWLRLSGKARKRKKKLSRREFGTSHRVSRDEAEALWEDGAEQIIVGTGQAGCLTLSPEAERFFGSRHCGIIALPTPEAIHAYNRATAGAKLGLFHVTC